MKITEYTYPYHHITIDNFLPKELFDEINNSLYDIDCEIPRTDGEYKRFSNMPSCIPLVNDADVVDCNSIHWDSSVNYVNRTVDILNTTFYFNNFDKINQLHNNFIWRGYYEIARDSFRPHTDNAWRNLIQNEYYAGIIKGVIYFGKDDIDYSNYGTVLIDPKTNKIVKEVEFKPNRLIIFDTRDDSLHATDYHGEFIETADFMKLYNNEQLKKTVSPLNQKRFSFNIEYCAKSELPLKEVEQLYNTINYPNSRILEWWMKKPR